MCGTPETRSHSVRTGKPLSSLVSELNSEQYADMVSCSNQARDCRQRKAERRLQQTDTVSRPEPVEREDGCTSRFMLVRLLMRLHRRLVFQS